MARKHRRDEPRAIPGDPVQMAVIARLTARHGVGPGVLLPWLHDLQAEFGFIDDRIVPALAAALNLSRADIHGVVTFYHDFRRKPAGRHIIRLCRAESCQARGGLAIEQAVVRKLGVPMGATRPDGRVTLEAVYCLGLCATGPNALVNGAPVSRIDAARLDRLMAEVGA